MVHKLNQPPLIGDHLTHKLGSVCIRPLDRPYLPPPLILTTLLASLVRRGARIKINKLLHQLVFTLGEN